MQRFRFLVKRLLTLTTTNDTSPFYTGCNYSYQKQSPIMPMINKKTLAVTLMLISSSIAIYAQYVQNNYFMETAIMRHQSNPAFLLDDRYITIPFLGNIQANISGNFGASTFIFNIDPATNNGYKWGTFMHPDVSNEAFYNKLGKSDVRAFTMINYNVFSMSFNSFHGTNIVELNVRSNAASNFPNELFRFAKDPTAKTEYDFVGLKTRAQAYTELALGHAHRINKDLTVGAKVKLLFGEAYANMDVEKLQLKMAEDEWAVKGRINASAAILNSHIALDQDGHFSAIENMKAGLTGLGLAIDLGATYQLHQVKGLEFSLALNDIGYIRNKVQNFKPNKDLDWTFNGFKNAYVASDKENSQDVGTEFKQLGEDFKDLLRFQETPEKRITAAIPMTLNVGAEYVVPFYEKMSIGLLHTQRINDLAEWHSTMLTARVRPVKEFEAALSTSVGTSHTCLGAAISLYCPGFSLILSSDQLLTKFSKQYIPINNVSTNVTLGMGIPLK